MSAATASAPPPPPAPPPPQLLRSLLLLLLLLALVPTLGTACNNMVLKALNIRACNQQSRMRNYDVTATLTKNCTVNLRACFNVTRALNQTKINYRINKPPINKAGSVDWCKEADDLCEEEEQRVGISCAATRAQGPPKKGAKQQQKRNKFAPVQCPLRPGRRCISHVLDVKEIKPHRVHVMGNFKVSATVDHGPAGSSCMEGTFTIADAAAKG